MRFKESIWNTDIAVASAIFFKKASSATAQYLCAVSLGLFIISPLIVGIPCLVHHNIDFTIEFHRSTIRTIIWPSSALFSIFGMIITVGKARLKNKSLLSILKTNNVIVCFAILSVLMVVSTTYNGWNTYVLFGAGLRFETVFMQIGYFTILFPSACIVRNCTLKKWLLRIHELVSLCLLIIALQLWSLQVESTVYRWSPALTAIYSNTNYYGYYLALTVSLSAAMFVVEQRAQWRLLSTITLSMNTIAMVYNDTLGAWVAGAVTMLFLMLICRKTMRPLFTRSVFIAAVFIVCLVVPGLHNGNYSKNVSQLENDVNSIVAQSEDVDRAGSGRWEIWQRGLELLSSYPLFGIGFEGVFARDIAAYAHNTRVHNEYLQYAVFYGIPAGIAYITGCILVFIRAYKQRDTIDSMSIASLSAAFGYLTSAFFGVTLFCTTPFLFIFLGMGCVDTQ